MEKKLFAVFLQILVFDWFDKSQIHKAKWTSVTSAFSYAVTSVDDVPSGAFGKFCSIIFDGGWGNDYPYDRS